MGRGCGRGGGRGGEETPPAGDRHRRLAPGAMPLPRESGVFQAARAARGGGWRGGCGCCGAPPGPAAAGGGPAAPDAKPQGYGGRRSRDASRAEEEAAGAGEVVPPDGATLRRCSVSGEP